MKGNTMQTIAIQSPGKYIQGAGLFGQIGAHVSPLADNVAVLADKFVLSILQDKLSGSLNASGVRHTIVPFNGECSRTEIERVKNIAEQNGAKAVIGVGGGKTLDAAKAVAYYAGLPVVVCPTIASTDAPCSALSVIYTDAGEFESYLFVPNNPERVLVDTEVVANAPVRLLAAGIGDALATWFEARACANSGADTMAGAKVSPTALTLAKLCYETLLENGRKAASAVKDKVVTPAVERVVEANTYLSGVGFESGGLAGAHSVHNGLTVLPETHHNLHGEKVTFGLLTQLMLENADNAELEQVVGLCVDVGLPVTLAQIGVTEDIEAKMRQVAEAACAEGDTMGNMPGNVQPADVYAALLAADRFGRDYLAKSAR